MRSNLTCAAALGELLAGELPAMLPLMKDLFPICRSLTGEGVRTTLDILGRLVPLQRHRIKTGTRCFDWEVPKEWNLRAAYVKDPRGKTVIDSRNHNLHVLGYSTPVRTSLPFAELRKHLHSLPGKPDAIPYRASYYDETWGFCLSHRQLRELEENCDGNFEVVIDSTLAPGHLDYAECVLPGTTGKEIFFSTYVCHPSMANNELSGPVLTATLMSILAKLPSRKYTYRALFAPETIGAIAYLSKNFEALKETMEAGYVVTCVGDDGPYNYVRSRTGNTRADKAAEHVFRHLPKDKVARVRDFDPVGSDERQYGSPGIQLPVGSILRSRHGEYPEYHTSEDDLAFVSEAGMQNSLRLYLRVLQTLELNGIPVRTNPFCEPQLGRHGLYPKFVTEGVEDCLAKRVRLLSFADGTTDLIDIANRMECPAWELGDELARLVEKNVLSL